MKYGFKYCNCYWYILFILFSSIQSLKSQTLSDIDTVWTKEVPMRSSLVSVIQLESGNYLAYGYNSYAAGYTLYANTTGSNTNEVYLAEFTESGNILRTKTISVLIPGTEGRKYITHTRVIERKDKGLLILSEYEHGGGESASSLTSTNKQRFSRLILNSSWDVSTNDVWGIEFPNFSFNSKTYNWVRAIRLFDLQRAHDNRIIAAFSGITSLSGVTLLGCVFMDDNGNPSPNNNTALKIITDKQNNTIVGAKRQGNHYVLTEDGTTIWRSTDLNCTAFNAFASIPADPYYLRLNYSKPTPIALPNSGGYVLVGITGNVAYPYNDVRYQFSGWRRGNNLSITNPSPYWKGDHLTVGGLFLLNPSGVSYDRLLTTLTECNVGGVAGNCNKLRIAEFVFTSTGVTLNRGNYVNTKNNSSMGFHLLSKNKDGIIGGGRTTSGETRMVLSKFSMCSAFKFKNLNNFSFISGATLPSKTIEAEGEFPNSIITYSWRIILKSGSLSSHSGSPGTVLATGNNNVIPAERYTLSGEDPAVLLVECTAQQTYGNPEQICNANGSYEIKIQGCPDNISDAECFIEPQAQTWGIKKINLSTDDNNKIHNYLPLLVGDIDGDGEVEIIAGMEDARSGPNYYPTKGLKIFTYNGTDITLKKKFYFTPAKDMDISTFGSIAMARYQNQGYIIVCGNDGFLYAYSPEGVRHWKSQTGGLSPQAMMGIADFNNDGIPEVYAENSIFSLSTGKLLCNGGGNNKGLTLNGSFTFAADITGDGKLELCAGNQIYKVTITNPSNQTGNDMSVISGLSLPASEVPLGAVTDGVTQAVDIDLDGRMEIVVTSIDANNNVILYVWKPEYENQSKLLGSINLPSTLKLTRFSIPMIGNIDSDPYPEILLITSLLNNLYAIKYDPTKPLKQRIGEKWRLAHTDDSGCTGMSLFDFDLNGKSEIVYRDQTTLRILDGSGNKADTLSIFNNVISYTLRELPVIADLDGDGYAEIVVSGGRNTAEGQIGFLQIFGASDSPWAPARTVWNQYAYNAVNVNEDLTIPKFQFNPATVFSGKDGIVGTADDVRPYNAFLQQQTILNKNGTPLFLTPNAEWNGSPTYNYNTMNDILTVGVSIKNTGDAALGAPIYVTAYKNSISEATALAVGKYSGGINKGETKDFSFTIPNFKSKLPINNLILRLNDSINTGGTRKKFPYQGECDPNNNENGQAFGNLLNLYTKHVKVIACDSVDFAIKTTGMSLIKKPKWGEFVIVDANTGRYTDTLPCSPMKIDTIAYRVCAGNLCSEAEIRASILPLPKIVLEDSCSYHPKLSLDYQYDAIYTWFYSDDNGITWKTPEPNSTASKLDVYKAGKYKVTLNIEGKEVLLAPVGFRIVRTSIISDNLIWYETTLE